MHSLDMGYNIGEWLKIEFILKGFFYDGSKNAYKRSSFGIKYF